jgi:CheY-like chemotaxis protein
MAEAKSIRLQSLLDPDAWPVAGDASRLQQVVWNLLTNAIKFTPKGGRVQVRVERLNSHIEIVVSGQGIASEFLPHVFDRFRQAETGTTRQHGGLGLGLAIVRHLVESHGGSVRADSKGEDQGATFTVRLPVMPVRSVHAQQGEQVHPTAETKSSLTLDQTPNLAGVQVLVVDDEEDARNLLRAIIEQCGAEVRVAGSASEALRIAKEWPSSIIVSDIGMPREDGYELIQRLRAWEKESGTWIPAVALTAYARTEDRVRALSAGYQIHIAKPIDPAELVLAIASQLGRGGK